MKTIYHVFTHNHDEYVDDLKTAMEIYRDMCSEYGSARLYEQQWKDTKEDNEPQSVGINIVKKPS